MKIAIIGSGISGLTSAYYLNQQHDVTVFEKESQIGGHTATKQVKINQKKFLVDTGFIVFNNWTYPNFIRLMAEIGVPCRDSEMSFSVYCKKTGLQWSGSGFKGIFAQRKNIFSIYFLKMLKDVVRFNKQAPLDIEQGKVASDVSLNHYLTENKYSEGFIKHYLIPMGAAIWSTSLDDMLDFPVHFFVRFFKNHGLLSVKNRPVWKTIVGGSCAYLSPLTESFKENIVLNANITAIERQSDSIVLKREGYDDENFDHVIFSCHSDQALSLLEKPSEIEQEILGAIPYKKNEVVLHTDSKLLPPNTKVRSSWNYTLEGKQADKTMLTYDMNRLQGIQSEHDFLVSLNQSDKIDPKKVLGHYEYSHPQFTLASMSAQSRWAEISQKCTWYCGAYWRNGFHEDGVYSALRVVNAIQGENENSTILEGKARASDMKSMVQAS